MIRPQGIDSCEIGDRRTKLEPQTVDLLTYSKNYNYQRDQEHLFWHDWHILFWLSTFMGNQVIIKCHISNSSWEIVTGLEILKSLLYLLMWTSPTQEPKKWLLGNRLEQECLDQWVSTLAALGIFYKIPIPLSKEYEMNNSKRCIPLFVAACRIFVFNCLRYFPISFLVPSLTHWLFQYDV